MAIRAFKELTYIPVYKSLYYAHKYTNKRVKKYQARLNIFSQRVKVY